MSSLIFYTDPQQVLVVTDTLAVDRDGLPFLFTSKAHYVPHLSLIVVATGTGRFSDRWLSKINTQMLVSGIEQLDAHTPEALLELMEGMNQEDLVVDGKTSTVYHFGISEVTHEVASFAYRSTNNFASERLQYGTGVKPECTVPNENLFEHLQAMMLEQRQIQSLKPQEGRVHIGGDAIAIHLTAEHCNHQRLFRFQDYVEQWEHAARALGTPG